MSLVVTIQARSRVLLPAIRFIREISIASADFVNNLTKTFANDVGIAASWLGTQIGNALTGIGHVIIPPAYGETTSSNGITQTTVVTGGDSIPANSIQEVSNLSANSLSVSFFAGDPAAAAELIVGGDNSTLTAGTGLNLLVASGANDIVNEASGGNNKIAMDGTNGTVNVAAGTLAAGRIALPAARLMS